MTLLEWSILLEVIGVTGLWLAGSHRWYGWAINLGAQIVWAAYSVSTRQYGFIAGCFAYGFVYFRNMRKERRK